MEYFHNICNAITTISKSMVVTMKHFILKKPITIQYPDRTEKPVKEMLPDRYRGFLKVDSSICTGCMACMRACPISCIKITVEKKDVERYLVSFKIDQGKCMYCGLCVEPCPTGAIFFTKEFEKATCKLGELIFEHIKEERPVYKPKKEKSET